MKANKLYIILALFLGYIITYICIGKDNLGLEIIECKNFPKNQNSIQIHLYNLEDYKRNQLEVKTILKEKGVKNIRVHYAENFVNENTFSYWLELQQLAPFVFFSYDGIFKKNEISKEYESLYIWCFFKWIKVYRKEKV